MKKSLFVLVNLLVVASLLLAACGGAATPAPTTAPTAAPAAPAAAPAAAGVIEAKPGLASKMVLLPKFLGILPFDEAHQGAQEAAKELGNTETLEFLGPTPENSVAGQIEIMTNATTQGVGAVMLSNNAGDQIAPAAEAAQAAGTKIVTWDSPIPSGVGESLFVAQVDFTETGQVMADMARSILGPDGGNIAILSASPDAANQNAWIEAFLAVLATPEYSNIVNLETVYGDDQSEKSYDQAQALISKYPDIKLIMSPTSVGIVAGAKALQDEGLCEDIKISGLGVPAEMVEYTLNGCAPEFALWSFVDLGYLTYYVSYLLATGAIQGADGEVFSVGRPISGATDFTITADPTRPEITALRVLMGPFTVYNKDNVEASAK